jgi:hypothetical protein
MQPSPAHSQAAAEREACFDRLRALAKTDSMKLVADIGVDFDAERPRGGQAIGHDAFTAGFVYRRVSGIGDHHCEAAAARGDGGGQTGGTASDDEDVSGGG